MSSTTEALVLRVIEYSETSRLFQLYTRDFGKLTALAKGAKRARTFYGCAADLFCRLEVTLWSRKDSALMLMSGGRVHNAYLGLREELPRIHAASFIAEFLRVLTEQQGSVEIYGLASAALGSLAAGANRPRTLLDFLAPAFRELGVGLELGRCTRCSVERPRGRSAWLSYRDGGLLCRACRQEEGEHVPWGPGPPGQVRGAVLEAIRGVAAGRVSGDTEAPAGPDEVVAAARLLADYAVFSSECEFRSLRFLA